MDFAERVTVTISKNFLENFKDEYIKKYETIDSDIAIYSDSDWTAIALINMTAHLRSN